MAYYLQYGPKRQIIEGFRGVGKSWVTSAFALWKLLRDPQEKILVVSASKTRADEFSTFTLRLLKEVPILVHLAPRPDQRESKISFDVAEARPSHSPSVKSVGIYGQLAGSRATHIIADDIEVPNNSMTADMREKLLKAVAEFEAILVPEGSPRITYLGTPQTEESIYNKLTLKGYERRIWTARCPSLEDIDRKYKGELAPMIISRIQADESAVGKPTDPQRFDEIDLMEREISYGKSGFALQFMLDTELSDSERYPLKTSDFIVAGINMDEGPVCIQYGSSRELQLLDVPNVGFSGDRWYAPMYFDKAKWQAWEGSVMAIDPSGRGQDETTYAIVKELHGNLFLKACGGFQGGYEDTTLVALARLARMHKVNHIVIEGNFGDGMFQKIFDPVLLRYHPCTTEEVKHNTQKEVRIIDTLEPVLNAHRLVIDPEVIRADYKAGQDKGWAYSLIYQLTRITKARGALKHDDRLDALTMAVRYWVDSMDRDDGKAFSKWKQDQIEKELEVFMEHAVGAKLGFNFQSLDTWR